MCNDRGDPYDDYAVGTLVTGEEPAKKLVATILVCPFEDKVVAVFPHNAWNKKVSKRSVPAGPFVKPSLVEVAAASVVDRSQPAAQSLKVWIGLLSRSVADSVVFGGLPEDCDVPFVGSDDQPAFPFAPALVQVADAQFGFVTAPSDVPAAARLSALESAVAEMASSMKTLLQRQSGALPPPTAKPAAKPPARLKPGGSVPGTPQPR